MRTIAAILLAAFASLAQAAVSGSVSHTDATAAGGTNLSFTFPVNGASEIEVFVNGVKQTSGYTVSLDAIPVGALRYPGGTVVFGVAPAVGAKLRVARTLPLTQSTVLSQGSPFHAKTIERTFDNFVMQAQQIDRRVADAEVTHASDKAAQAAQRTADLATQATRDSGQDSGWANSLSGEASARAAGDTGARSYAESYVEGRIAAAARVDPGGVGDNATVIAPGTPTARTLAARFGGPVKDVRDFGVKCDGVADDTDELIVMRAYARLHYGTTFLFPENGTCRYTRNYWTAGIKSAKFIGRGTKLSMIRPWRAPGNESEEDGFAMSLVTNKDYFVDVSDTLDQASYASTDQLWRINAAAARQPIVTTTTAADAGNLAPGDEVLLYGYNLFNGGFPPDARFFEFKTVKAANGSNGQVEFTQPLMHTYDDRWHDNTGAGWTTGAPRLLKLTRGAGKFNLADDLYFEGFEFTKVPNQPANFGAAHGYVYAGGAKRIEFKNCIFGTFVPSEAGQVIVTDSEMEDTEPDKLVESVIYERAVIDKLMGGTGVHHSLFKKCVFKTLISYVNWTGGSIIFDDNDIYAVSDEQTMAASVARYVKFTNNRFYRPSASTVKIIHGGADPYPMTVVGTGVTGQGARYIDVALDLSLGGYRPFSEIYTGSRIYRALWANYATVGSIYWSGANVRIEGTFRTVPQVGDVFYVKPSGTLVAEDNSDVHSGARVFTAGGGGLVSFGQRSENYVDSMENGLTRKIVISLDQIPQNGDPMLFTVGGHILSITWTVLQPNAGIALLAGQVGGLDVDWWLDTGTAGVRKIDNFVVTNELGGDAINAPVGPGFVDTLYLDYTTPPVGPLPDGYVVIEVLRRN